MKRYKVIYTRRDWATLGRFERKEVTVCAWSEFDAGIKARQRVIKSGKQFGTLYSVEAV